MFAAGIYDLGLTGQGFAELTPRHIDALWKRHTIAEERAEQYTRHLIVMYANANFRSKESHPQAFTEGELFPHLSSNRNRPMGKPERTRENLLVAADWWKHLLETGERLPTAEKSVEKAREEIEMAQAFSGTLNQIPKANGRS